MKQATPIELPWRIIGKRKPAIVGPKWPNKIGHFICSIQTNGGRTNRATAEFILRAVMNHTSLIEAVRNALRNIEIHELHNGRTGRFEPIKHQLRSALATVEPDRKHLLKERKTP